MSVCFVSSTVTKIHRKLLCGGVGGGVGGSTVPGRSADMCHSWWRQNRLKNKSRNDKCVVSGRRSEHKMHLTCSVKEKRDCATHALVADQLFDSLRDQPAAQRRLKQSAEPFCQLLNNSWLKLSGITEQTRRTAVVGLPAPRMRTGVVGAQRCWECGPKSALAPQITPSTSLY